MRLKRKMIVNGVNLIKGLGFLVIYLILAFEPMVMVMIEFRDKKKQGRMTLQEEGQEADWFMWCVVWAVLVTLFTLAFIASVVGG